jgi:hypothetical protein
MSASSSPRDAGPRKSPDEAAVRQLRSELARLQDQLRAEDRASGYRPYPGHTRRRADLLRRERAVIRELRQLGVENT